MFIEMWPIVQKHMLDREFRIELTANLLQLLVHDDMNPRDVEDIHPDVPAALTQSGIGIAEREHYTDDA